MKKLIVTAATAFEIGPFCNFLQNNYKLVEENIFQNERYQIHIVISGVGMMATAFSLATHLSKTQFDAAIQAGIAGSFDSHIPLGSVLGVESETYGDLGAEDNDLYIDIFELGFLKPDAAPFKRGKLTNLQPYFLAEVLPLVSSLSTNTVSGNSVTIKNRINKWGCQIENMEGIAFHYACLQHKIPFLQIRAISNFVTPRDKSKWDFKLAIDNLNEYLIKTFT